MRWRATCAPAQTPQVAVIVQDVTLMWQASSQCRADLNNAVCRWDRNVLAVRDPSFQPATDAGRPEDNPDPEPNPWLLQLGLRRDVCQDVLNPGSPGF
jgi:hypothetical protein